MGGGGTGLGGGMTAFMLSPVSIKINFLKKGRWGLALDKRKGNSLIGVYTEARYEGGVLRTEVGWRKKKKSRYQFHESI